MSEHGAALQNQFQELVSSKFSYQNNPNSPILWINNWGKLFIFQISYVAYIAQNNFVSAVENLKKKRFNLQKLIEVEKERKYKIEDEIEKARIRVTETDKKLTTLTSALADVDSTIAQSEEAFTKVCISIITGPNWLKVEIRVLDCASIPRHSCAPGVLL